MTTWKQLVEHEMNYQDDPGPVVAYHPDEAAFDAAYRSDSIDDLFAWTDSRVYHLSEMDEVGERAFVSAPRNPPGGAA